MTDSFEQHMLKSTNDLREGECYFDLGFYDTISDIPDIDTWIYIGKNILQSDGSPDERWYFQEPESYMRKGSFPHSHTDADDVLAATELDVLSMFSFEGLVQALSLLKPKSLT